MWKSGTARKSSLKLVTIQAKAKEKGRVKLTENVSAVDAVVSSEQIAEPKLTEDEETETSQNVPIGTIDLGSFLRYCQTMVMRWRMTNPHMKPKK